ncbi:unnamed protein product, partial [Heterotrigona itama]
MLERMISCTELEASQVLGKKFCMQRNEKFETEMRTKLLFQHHEMISRKSDKFASIPAVWDKFIRNSQSCYKLGANITIDKQLFPSKARWQIYPIKYLPNKVRQIWYSLHYMGFL